MGLFGINVNAAAKGVSVPAKTSVKLSSVIANAAVTALQKNALSAAAKSKAAASKSSAASKKAAQAAAANRNNAAKNITTNSRVNAGTSEITPVKNILIKWHDVEFYANAQQVRGLTDFSISGSVETEDKEAGGTKYVSKKNSKGYEGSITAFFDKRLGIDSVKDEAMKLVNYAANGQTGYLYAQDSKLVPCSLMLTSGKASKVIMTPAGVWISCEVTLTLKTCEKIGGGSDQPQTGSGYKFGCTVYYSGSSGAISSVWAGSNVSKEDARKKAWAKVPKTAQWASETKKQATNQSPKLTDAALEAARKRVELQKQQTEAAKTQSQNSGTGITNRNNQVQQKKLDRVK